MSLIELAKERDLDMAILGGRLDDKLAVGETLDARHTEDASGYRTALVLRELPLLQAALQVALDGRDTSGQGGTAEVVQQHVEAGLRCHLRDTATHLARTNDADRLNRVHLHLSSERAPMGRSA